MSYRIERGMDQIVGQLDLCSFALITVSYFFQETQDEVDTSQASEDEVNEVCHYNFY